jgi:hypothetical protein
MWCEILRLGIEAREHIHVDDRENRPRIKT